MAAASSNCQCTQVLAHHARDMLAMHTHKSEKCMHGCVQAVQALLAHMRQHIAPQPRSGTAMLAEASVARLLPTGCAK